jgi:hypothetical protein
VILQEVDSSGVPTSPCELMTCDAIKALGTVVINGVPTDFSNYDCFWTLERATSLGLNLDSLVFQTCIDKLGASFYKCQYYTCQNMPTNYMWFCAKLSMLSMHNS